MIKHFTFAGATILVLFIELNSSGFVQELYVHIGWPLYRKYGHAFEVSFFSFFENNSLYYPNIL